MAREAGHPMGHLLVVDDNKVNRLLLARGLEQQGHSVDFAVNGREALEVVRMRPFDLILLDIQMPELDGYQVLEELVSDPELRNIPVVMTSSTDELSSVARCIEMGAEDFLTKPVNPVLLRARINASLEKKWLRDQQQELLRKFATSEVAEDLLTAGFELGGHYVEATAMFSDIRGFSAIAETQDPADTIELLNTYYTLMFDAITGHGGVVNQMVGDGLMAIFGAPVPLEEHSHKAVMAALEMVELVELFNQEQAMLEKVQIKIGVGIASGQVIAGYTGTQHRATYTCVGETVNLAARLEGHTKEVGAPILIDEATRQGLRSEVPVREEEDFLPKGFSESVKAYTVPVGE
ncbi:MAG: adenylate/guanylate cyclase domain-containing protein [Anaerolineales bacterium]|nr:adenylate/guanylate cyclase domain-containing protein [Anaerolineales bacterium]